MTYIYIIMALIILIYLLFNSNELFSLIHTSPTKTLIGKDNYLFLINDSADEINVHMNNILYIDNNYLEKYLPVKHKFLLIVIPNKSYICKDYLPDNYDLKFRPAFELCKTFFNDNILDGYEILKNNLNTYYKTDTHINLYGNYLIYLQFIDKINILFNLNIDKKIITILNKETILSSEIYGIGDLTWTSNLGNQKINDINKKDIFYYSNDFIIIYNKYIIKENDQIRLLDYENNDITDSKINSLIDWTIISSYILYSKNYITPSYKVLIFYDSMLCSILGLYLTLFDEVYLSKSSFNIDLINLIKPDYIFEFRIERFIKN